MALRTIPRGIVRVRTAVRTAAASTRRLRSLPAAINLASLYGEASRCARCRSRLRVRSILRDDQPPRPPTTVVQVVVANEPRGYVACIFDDRRSPPAQLLCARLSATERKSFPISRGGLRM